MNNAEETCRQDKNNESKIFNIAYMDEEYKVLNDLYKETLVPINKYEIVKGTVVGINNKDVLISIGFKSDGVVSIAEFKDIPELKQGDEIEVYIEETEDASGQLVLSRKKAKLVRGWEKIQNALEHGETLNGLVKRRTKGGLIVEIFEIETFLPGSQIDIKPILDFDIFVEKNIDVAVIKINHTNDNVVVSHKALIEKKLEEQKIDIISNLEQGQILEGRVKNITKFGAFIDLGGVDGLLHITDISWSRLTHPSKVFELGQIVKVVVIGFNEDKKRISLGMKQLMEHPWDALPESIAVGATVKGKVVNIADYGIFIELVPGIEGLIHVSEISWSQYLRNPNELYKIEDEVEAVVLLLDRETHKISLGIKQLLGDPWERPNFLTQYTIGTKHAGVIRNITNFGGFLELEPGVEGLLHISGLSWTKRIVHPSELLKLGETIEVVILEIDKENKRLSLGLKQLEENPWETCETIFQLGTIHQGTITKVVPNKGASVELAHGIEGYVPYHYMMKEDGSEGVTGEELDFKVIKFSKADKKIILSHQATWTPSVPVIEQKLEKQQPKIIKQTRSSMSNKSSKNTSGGFEAFAKLKEQLINNQLDKKQQDEIEEEDL